MSFPEDVFKDITEPFTGNKAAAEAQQRATEDALKSRQEAAAARVFAETEGAGQGTVGEVILGIEEEEDDELESNKLNQVFKI